MKISISHVGKDHYDIFVGEKRAFLLRGATGKFILHDLRTCGCDPDIQHFHTAHAALCRVIDELVPEGT